MVGALLLSQPAGAAEPASVIKPWTGGPKPLFSLDTLTGRPNNLGDYRGRTVVVHFFATWCEPCRKEMTSLRSLSESLPKEKVAVIGVDVGEVDIRVRRFFESLPVDFPIVLDRDSQVAKAWQVDALPATFVLDQNLSPKYVVEGDIDWHNPDIGRLLTDIKRSDASHTPRIGGT